MSKEMQLKLQHTRSSINKASGKAMTSENIGVPTLVLKNRTNHLEDS